MEHFLNIYFHKFLSVYILSTFLFALASANDSNTRDQHWAVKITEPSTIYKLLTEESQFADAIATELGLINKGRMEPFKDLYRFQVPPDDHQGHTLKLRSVQNFNKRLNDHPNILWSSQQVSLKRTKRTVPRNEYTPIINFNEPNKVGETLIINKRSTPLISFNDPKYKLQWHLVNTRESGHDVNMTGIWKHNITGRGVVVAVVDDGLEHRNVDITDNYNPAGSYDFNSEDSDPSPNLKTAVDNTHGTRCAGLIAAVANNRVCGVGVAHRAQVSGIRMLDGTVTDILEGQSFIYKAHVNDVYSCSWGPEDNGRTIEGPGDIAKEALELGTKHGRNGYGNVYVFASGNGGTSQDNCNYDGYANSVYTLTIGAVDELNRMPYYAEPCAAMLAVTYSNGQRRNIVTTDGSNHGGCTTGFSGTSAAAPIAAGMVALMLEVRPCLSWRDLQSIVIYSAVKVDAKGALWIHNGAGFHHSDQHGFGLMDAYRLTMTAAVWPLLPAMVVCVVEGGGWVKIQEQPLIQSVEVSRTDLTEELVTLEYVAITMTVSHACRGALEVSLVSPNNTLSTLVTPRRYDDSKDGFDWTFTTARFWGEGPIGTWTLNITDHAHLCPGRVRSNGALKKWTLTFYGSATTSDDVATRQRLVEDAVANGSLESPFLCPVIDHQSHDIQLPLQVTHSSLNLWEKIGLTVVIVMIFVTIIHFTSDCVVRKIKECYRPRPPATAVLFTRRDQTTGDGGYESEETCALLIQDRGVANTEMGVVLNEGNGNGNNNQNDCFHGNKSCDLEEDVDTGHKPDSLITHEDRHASICGTTIENSLTSETCIDSQAPVKLHSDTSQSDPSESVLMSNDDNNYSEDETSQLLQN